MGNIQTVKKISKEKGISMAFICRQIGKSHGYLAELASRDADIPEKMLEPVANALGVTVAELTGEEQKEKPSAPEGDWLEALYKECEGLDKDDVEEARRYIAYLKAKRNGI